MPARVIRCSAAEIAEARSQLEAGVLSTGPGMTYHQRISVTVFEAVRMQIPHTMTTSMVIYQQPVFRGVLGKGNEDSPEYLEAGSLNEDEVQGLQHVRGVGGCRGIADRRPSLPSNL